MSRTVRSTLTDQYSFRLRGRWFKEPQVILQRQVKHEIGHDLEYSWGQYTFSHFSWQDVTLTDLTTMKLEQLINPREGGEFPICFKPVRSGTGWCLVLQVCEGAYEHNIWRDARVQDLLIKDGRIVGGLGLVRR